MFDVFICYSHKHPIYADLVEEKLLADQFQVFRDVTGIPSSQDWQQEIDNALSASTVFLVVITQEALESSEVMREIALAIELKKPCIVVVMEKFNDVGAILAPVGLNKRQAIDVAVRGWNIGAKHIIADVKRFTDTWAPKAEMIRRLGHFSPIVRMNSVRGLAPTNDIRALDALLEAFEVEHEVDIKGAILKELYFFDDERAIDLLLVEGPALLSSDEIFGLIDSMLKNFRATATYIESTFTRIPYGKKRVVAAYCLYNTLGEPWKEPAFNAMCALVSGSYREYPVILEAAQFLAKTKDLRAKPLLQSILKWNVGETMKNEIIDLIATHFP